MMLEALIFYTKKDKTKRHVRPRGQNEHRTRRLCTLDETNIPHLCICDSVGYRVLPSVSEKHICGVSTSNVVALTAIEHTNIFSTKLYEQMLLIISKKSKQKNAYRKDISTKTFQVIFRLGCPPTRRFRCPNYVGAPLTRPSSSPDPIGGPPAWRSPSVMSAGDPLARRSLSALHPIR